MGGMLEPIGGQLPGRIMTDIATLGLAEALPSDIKEPIFRGTGQLFFSPAAGLAAGGAGLIGAGGIGAGGMGAAAPSGMGAAAGGLPPVASGAGAATGLPASTGSMIGEGGKAAAAKTSGSDMLQNAFLATSVGGMLGNAIKPPPLPMASMPNAPIGGGGGFTPVANGASQQWAQLMAQRRAQQTGKFTV